MDTCSTVVHQCMINGTSRKTDLDEQLFMIPSCNRERFQKLLLCAVDLESSLYVIGSEVLQAIILTDVRMAALVSIECACPCGSASSMQTHIHRSHCINWVQSDLTYAVLLYPDPSPSGRKWLVADL